MSDSTVKHSQQCKMFSYVMGVDQKNLVSTEVFARAKDAVLCDAQMQASIFQKKSKRGSGEQELHENVKHDAQYPLSKLQDCIRICSEFCDLPLAAAQERSAITAGIEGAKKEVQDIFDPPRRSIFEKYKIPHDELLGKINLRKLQPLDQK